MPGNEITGAAALVTGASRGFGSGIATVLSKAGANVVGVARDRGPLEEMRAQLGESFTAVPADAADPVVAGQLIDAYHPAILVLNAGASRSPGGPALTPEQVGQAIVDLTGPAWDQDAYLITAAGLRPLP
jgi:short-subunit dehydrogenase